MSGVAYTGYELRRTFRNRRFLLFSLGFPLVFYFLVAVPQSNIHSFGGTGLSVPLYYMVGLAAFGTTVSMISTGARIAGERQAGWTRQLRISPLSVCAYVSAKVLTGYGMALASLLLLYASGAALGVSLPAGHWLEMTGLILVGLLPFAALGILIGHLVSTDSVGPVIGGGVSLLAFLGRHLVPDHERIPAHVVGGGLVRPGEFVNAARRAGTSTVLGDERRADCPGMTCVRDTEGVRRNSPDESYEV